MFRLLFVNHVLYIAAIVQIHHDTPGRTYYRRKIAERAHNQGGEEQKNDQHPS